MGIGALRRHRERLGKSDQNPMGLPMGGSVRHEYAAPEVEEPVQMVEEPKVEEQEDE